MTTALLLIDLQNDYFPDGRFPLWNTAPVLDATETAIAQAYRHGLPVIHIQHLSEDPAAPLFRAGSHGAAIHPRMQTAASDAPVIVKRFADAFHQTGLDHMLQTQGVERLLVGGMMTQNCVTHTVLSRAADRYECVVLADCTTSVSEPIHRFALTALATRLAVVPFARAL